MSFYPQTVVLKGRVYFGGGSSPFSYLVHNTVVIVYDPERSQWTPLPQYRYAYFTMTVIKEQLVLVGGRSMRTNLTTGVIGAWEEKTRKWVHPLPPMPTTCDAATAIAHDDKWLVVAGGRDDGYRSLSKVDILNLSTKQWHTGAPLPQPSHKMTAAVLSGTAVLLGGASGDFHNKVFSVCLDQLISQALFSDTHHTPASQWLTLPDTPASLSTALALKGTLLAVGGVKNEDLNLSSPIYLYRPSSESWVETGKLPVSRITCACTVLPSGEVFIAGGAVPTPHGQTSVPEPPTEVDIAMLQ